MTDRTNIRLTPAQIDRIEVARLARGEKFRNAVARELVDKGFLYEELEVKGVSPDSVELDSTTKQNFFRHLSGGKGKEYQESLMGLELTEQELIDLAIEKSGMRYSDLVKQALVSMAKEVVTRHTRNEYLTSSGKDTPEIKLQKAFAELTEKMFEGSYVPRGGQLKLSKVAMTAGVNYETAKKWALENQPELLE